MILAQSSIGSRVDHHNTGQPHTHIVIRGVDDRGKDLLIAPDYIKSGMRQLASELITRELGPRRDMEIAHTEAREVTQERFTTIDRDIARMADRNQIKIGNGQDIYERFHRSMVIKRLGALQELGLATKTGYLKWELTEGWDETLKRIGKRGDIIRSMTDAISNEHSPSKLKIFDASEPRQQPILGRIAHIGAEDELARYALYCG